jgi:hypothetical protein
MGYTGPLLNKVKFISYFIQALQYQISLKSAEMKHAVLYQRKKQDCKRIQYTFNSLTECIINEIIQITLNK